MILRKWDDLPDNMKNESVRKYYDQLRNKFPGLVIKRLFDLVVSILGIVVLSPLLILIGILIRLDSEGPALFRQVRVTQYGKRFIILKFRSMVLNAEKKGAQVTAKNDNRITSIGKFLRKHRLDELPQLINIISGDMSFVGTRPEVVKYVDHYTDEMMATLLLPAGVTSEASISYKDEDRLLSVSDNVDQVYLQTILPQKMKYNLESLEESNFFRDISIIFRTLIAVLRKE